MAWSDKISIIKGDITVLPVDAIVNATNVALLPGAGVSGAIFAAAGAGLVKECMEIGGAKTGEAKITGGYELLAKHVIHAVGPIWRGGTYGEAEALASCYKNSLLLAEEKGIKTIAFPSISTGIYGFPIQQAVLIVFRTLKEFLEKNNTIERVTLVLFSDKDYSVYLEEYRRVKEG